MKNIHRFTTLLAPVAAFVAVLLVMNGYQYFKLKDSLAAGVVTKVTAVEIGELRSFFTTIEEKLQMVRDWGKNDILFTSDTIALNKKFIPMLEHQKIIGAITIANTSGREYFLYKNKQGYLTRSSVAEDAASRMSYNQLSEKGELIKKWQETGEYDPRLRPWFVHVASEKKVVWSDVYTFYHSKVQGVTASVSWKNPKDPSRYTVFAMDVPLSAIGMILSRESADRPGVFFLVSGKGNLLISSNEKKEQEEEKHILSILIEQWQKDGDQNGNLIKKTFKGKHWLASFQKVDHEDGFFWLGYAGPESELVNLLTETILSTDIIDLFLATLGAVLTFLLIWKMGIIRLKAPSVVSPSRRLHKYIKQGEGADVEFKSTIRTNLKTGKKGKEIEFAWLKALVAFLNSNGGALLLGVTDSGEICGLEEDNFENNDRCLLHVKNLINQHVGAEFYNFIVVTLVAIENQEVVMLECKCAGRPVFLKIGKNEEFYIRSGPSSTKLSPSQMMNFVQKHKD